MLRAEALYKSFGKAPAVRGVSLTLEPGQVMGLLGPNGAGKSTTVAMLCGLLAPDSGRVMVNDGVLGGDTSHLKRQIGVAPQELALYDNLSALANLELFGALYGMNQPLLRKRAGDVLQTVGLADRAHAKPATFSGGMKRRLNLACALVHDPAILLLDEPTAGVDPQSRNALFSNLEMLKAEGKAILYTTHYMEEAERLCDRVIIMDHGRVLANDTLRGLYRMLPAAESLSIELANPDSKVDTQALLGQPGVRSVIQKGDNLEVGIDDLSSGTPVVTRWLQEQGHGVVRIQSAHANLESVFLALTGRALRD